MRIDRTDKSLHGIFDWLVGYTEKYAYTANALAIKYTQAVAGSFAGYLRPGWEEADDGHSTIAMGEFDGSNTSAGPGPQRFQEET